MKTKEQVIEFVATELKTETPLLWQLWVTVAVV